MRPTIVQPANVSGAALAELKAWLGINRPNDDLLLSDILLASLSSCEEVIGQVPLLQTVEERLPPKAEWQTLATCPVRTLVSAEIVNVDGTITVLSDQSANLEIDASGSARFLIEDTTDARAIAVQVQAGIADVWENLPPVLKQGIIRLAAFYYRERDQASAKQMPIPLSVTALWQPFRQLRLT